MRKFIIVVVAAVLLAISGPFFASAGGAPAGGSDEGVLSIWLRGLPGALELAGTQ
jgi:hypothetical protein